MNGFIQTSGEKIKASRMRLGFTQQQLADRLNESLTGSEVIERSMISRWEKDQNFPRNSRREALEQLLSITLDSQPARRETFSTYMTTRSEIDNALLLGLQDCSEVWMTTLFDQHSIWNELPGTKELFQKLRQSKKCLVKELYYIRDQADLEQAKELVSHEYPLHAVRIRTAPGHPFPILIAPHSRFGVFLAGFFDDITSVGLELSGQVAGFNEHYFRHIWNKGSAIYEYDKFFPENYEQAKGVMDKFGGEVKNEFIDRR